MSNPRMMDISDIEALAWTTRTAGVDPNKFTESKKMITKAKQPRGLRYSIRADVTLPKLKFLDGDAP